MKLDEFGTMMPFAIKNALYSCSLQENLIAFYLI